MPLIKAVAVAKARSHFHILQTQERKMRLKNFTTGPWGTADRCGKLA
jgi:hypothetical protein